MLPTSKTNTCCKGDDVTQNEMDAELAGSIVLVTGGTGSFGSTMTRSLLDRPCAEIRILSRDEAKQDQMRHEMADERVRFHLGDIRDTSSVEQAMDGVDFVFHAAALKQVPSCEFFPLQAVRTNVIGTDNVIEAAHQAHVRSVVCLSTDKAVYPINAMGMSKALMEKTAQAFARNRPDSPTNVSLVRYGNVMYSRGSVIPLFVRQLAESSTVTVTEPSMTRFMMTLAESVDLVEHAFVHSKPGDLFVRKAPAATVGCLVDALGDLFGVAVKISRIGIRHGEKLHETLATREELSRSVESPDYFRIALDARGLDYAIYFEEGDPEGQPRQDYDSGSTRQLDVEELKGLLISIPELRADLARAGRPVDWPASK